ncbi:unnamed protein product [Spirodela intermedia]|uniref:Uncharacterized protein n=1 Tax=Spirodela intermedia TaxID=51605 RepID=A0A7I8J044_SPIIN|nr:unnamed protein product [Spirodela intermedia]CAA6663585.1 unnamed protein product [Spirodela intermedia]
MATVYNLPTGDGTFDQRPSDRKIDRERERTRERREREREDAGWNLGAVGGRGIGDDGVNVGTVMFLWMAIRQFFPYFSDLHLRRWVEKMVGYVYPYVQISFPEFVGERLKRSEAFTAIEIYLSANCGGAARRLRAELGKDSSQLVLSMDEHQEVVDVFEGVSFWWSSSVSIVKSPQFSFYPTPEGKRSYQVTFHRRHRDLVNGRYLAAIMAQGREILAQRRQRKLFTNSPSRDSDYRQLLWSHVPFEHPATFDTIAMDPQRRMSSFRTCSTSATARTITGRWARHGREGTFSTGPRTGKSTMIAAMANLLEYDVYDLELTAVKDNSSLRRLLIETSSKSIIVIEDIDCSLDLTGSRRKKAAAAPCWGGDRRRKKDHRRFSDVRRIIEEVDITPADIAELLMPRSRYGGAAEADACMDALVRALEDSKAKAAAARAAEAAEAAAGVVSLEPEKTTERGKAAGKVGPEPEKTAEVAAEAASEV